MPIVNFDGIGEIDVPEEVLRMYTPDQFRRILVQDAARYAEENDIDMDTFSRQFAKEVTSTSRGLQEMVTGERTTDARSDFLSEVALEKDAFAGYSGMIAGALADPVTAPFALLKLFKLGRVGTAALAGAFGGGAGAVREEYGEDRLTNAAVGAGAGAALGAVVNKLIERFGVNNIDDLQKVYDEGGASVQKEIEEILSTESEALQRMGEAGRTADTQQAEVARIRGLVDDPEIADITRSIEAERAAKAADVESIKQVGKDAELERIRNVADEFKAEQDADVARQIQDMREEVATLPTGRQQQGIKRTLTDQQGSIKALNKQIAKLRKEIQDTRKNKKIAPKDKRAPIQDALRRIEELRKEAGVRQQQVKQRDSRLVERLRDLRKAEAELKTYDKTGKLPSFVKVNKPTGAPVNREELQLPQGIGAQRPVEQRLADMQPTQAIEANAPSVATRDAQIARIERNLAQAQARPSAPAPAQFVTQAPPTQQPPVQQSPMAPTAPAPRESEVKRKFDAALGAISTRLEKIAPPLMNALRKYEMTVLDKQAKLINPTEEFFNNVKKFSPSMRTELKGHLYNGRVKEAEAMMNPEMVKQYRAIRKDLFNVYKDLKDAGIDVGWTDNYFPRKVKDVEGLREKLGRENPDKFSKALADAVEKNKGRPLTPEQEEEVLNQVVRNVYRPKDPTRGGSVGKRTLADVPDDILPFYEDPSTALTRYYREMVDRAEKARFFGRNAQVKDDKTIDTEDSIGRAILDARVMYNLLPQQVDDLARMLTARFVEGEKAPNILGRLTRDTGYMGTIGNMVSAITNLGDLGTSGALHGFGETIQAALEAGVGRKMKYNVIDMGIDHSISHELQDTRLTSQALQKIFTASGFRWTDRLGKNTLMNAAMRKNEKLAETEAGRAALRKRWGETFGNETESLIEDLSNGNISENTKLLAFNELSNVQPISLSEMPQYYLESPDGRIFYMLKSFTLKQLDLVRKNVIQEAKRGNYFQASKNLALLGGYLAAANTGTQVVKDFILGRDVDPEKIPDQAIWNVLGVIGINKYIADRYLSQGDVMGALTNTVIPPVPVLDVVRKGYKETERMLEGEEYNYAKLTKELPLVGRIIYSHFGGGKENYNERLAKEE